MLLLAIPDSAFMLNTDFRFRVNIANTYVLFCVVWFRFKLKRVLFDTCCSLVHWDAIIFALSFCCLLLVSHFKRLFCVFVVWVCLDLKTVVCCVFGFLLEFENWLFYLNDLFVLFVFVSVLGSFFMMSDLCLNSNNMILWSFIVYV